MDDPKTMATWAGGIAAGIATVAVALSKIARGYSSDRQATATGATSGELYALLLKENKRIDERNQSLEQKYELAMTRLSQLEIVHLKLANAEQENSTLKASVIRKDEQLTAMIKQQSSDRKEFLEKYREQLGINRQLNLKIQHLEAATFANRSTDNPQPPSRRVEDIHPEVPLNFEDENNV